ncbi:uncharacterized protein LOC135488475 [Lineus longissimus]|uniref:uncharacterized protein LOC135488475 n=1 Tax=Lineus longissimus TaxID=88925 RepID=UPI002B4D5722
MLATQSAPGHLDRAFKSTGGALKGDINEILTSGQYYVTPEMTRELRSVGNGVEHFNVDAYLQNSASSWRHNLGPGQVASDRAATLDTMQKTQGFLSDMKSKMNKQCIGQLQANEIQQTHHWAMQNLQGLKGEMTPYAQESNKRIQQFSDHIGVTDRYTGYRNNLTRGSRTPFKLDTYWNREQNKEREGIPRSRSAPKQVSFNQYALPMESSPSLPAFQATPRSAQVGNRVDAEPPCGSSMARRPPATQSIQEACGINTTFPGKSEYKTRYSQPPPKPKTSDFIINPQPNFHIHGRPLAKIAFEPSYTEYQYRYEWPDGARITRLPWLRK